MKDTCVVRVGFGDHAHFYDELDSSAYIPSWPAVLSGKFKGAGVYSIRRVEKSSSRSVRVIIVGIPDSHTFGCSVPAAFTKGVRVSYGICARFLRELGVTPPPKGKRKTLHLVVTKRRSK